MCSGDTRILKILVELIRIKYEQFSYILYPFRSLYISKDLEMIPVN